MSSLDVKIRKITQLDLHPNADKLELVVIGGYKAVVQKDLHKVGDLILYIPTDSVFTDTTIADKLGVRTYLVGSEKNRVKGIRLRGIYSEGIVLPLTVVDNVLADLGYGFYLFHEDLDFSEELKIEKYEEPVPIEMMGQVRKWPSFIEHYDIENVKKPEYFNSFQVGEEVLMTEKIHGTNCAIGIGPGLEEGEDAFVCSRNNALKESSTNVYWRTIRKYGIIDKLKQYVTDNYNSHQLGNTTQLIESISLHGEVVGTQDLKYGHTKDDAGFYAFDIRINEKYLDYHKFKGICTYYGIPTAPVLYRGPYDYEKLKTMVERKTTLADHIMEGGVVQPVKERVDSQNNRVKLKIISEQYLDRKGKTTEYH